MSKNRGKVYVDKKVQGALARRIALHWLAFFLVSLVALVGLEYLLGNPALSFREHLSIVWQKYAFFVLLMLTLVPSFIYDAVKLSNRFTGPMVRLRKSMKSVADGESVGELKFRDGDFWGEVSDEFNRMKKRLSDAQSQAQA